MKIKIASRLLLGLGTITLAACSSLAVLPDSKLQETASAVVGKPMKSISNVRRMDDMSYFDAHASDGTNYACSLQVVLGFSSQHQKCEKK